MARLPYPTISQGADGFWHAWVTVGTKPNGRPDQRHVKRRDRDDVITKVDELLAQKRAGATTKAGRAPTVQQWMETFLQDVAPRRCTDSTLYDYRSKCRNWVYPHIGRVRVDRLKPEQLDAMYLAMIRAGKAWSHALKVHRIMSRALEVAHRRGLVPRNVAKLIDAPTGKATRMQYLAGGEAGKVLAAAAGRRNAARWSVALAIGLRQGESLGLRWPLVDLDAGTLEIPKQLRRRIYEHGCGGMCGRKRGADCPRRTGGGLVLVDPKGKSARTVPIPPQLVAKLKAHRTAQNAERLKAGQWWHGCGGTDAVCPPNQEKCLNRDGGGDFVFAQENGRPIDPRADHAEWKDILAAAGVRKVRLHDARHTAATLMKAQGVDLDVIGEVLGHTDSRTTRGYAQVVNELTRDATDRMGRLLFGDG